MRMRQWHTLHPKLEIPIQSREKCRCEKLPSRRVEEKEELPLAYHKTVGGNPDSAWDNSVRGVHPDALGERGQLDGVKIQSNVRLSNSACRASVEEMQTQNRCEESSRQCSIAGTVGTIVASTSKLVGGKRTEVHGASTAGPREV
jgi:hypothetical protein